MSKSELQCSFCGKKKNQTSLLIAGIDAHICDMCIEQANGIILQESQTRSESISKKSNKFVQTYKIIKKFIFLCYHFFVYKPKQINVFIL